MYQLSSTLRGHDDDVKDLACFDNDVIVSVARDSTVRVWRRQTATSFDSSIINFKSNKFINALGVLPDLGLIVSAGNDNLISITDSASDFLMEKDPKYCLVGHTDNVCSIDTMDDLIISGSWDGTAKVWNLQGDVLFDLKGHEFYVWSVKFISKTSFLTCGADGTLRKWNGSKCVKEIKAHEHAVRDLIRLSNGDIATCSNDTTIKIWDFVTFELKRTLIGHDNFVYSLALAPNGDIISSGEDRSIRIWRNFQCIQVLTLPCISVWKIIVLPNGDIVSGSSDSVVRVFSTSRIADDLELQAFKKDLESSSISESAIDGIDKSKLPGLEALQTPGEAEGEIKYINSNSKMEIHQWSNGVWVKVGEIVTGNSSNQKKFFNGGYYDFVFDVDIADGAPPLKLALNLSDNPYEIAEQFLAENELPYSYLQEIVNFILKNAEGVTLDHGKSSLKILPIKTYVGFEGFNESQIFKGFTKSNDIQREEYQIPLSKFETVMNCEDFNELSVISGEIIEHWEGDSKLIGFDILRGIMTKIQPFDNLFPIIKTGLDSSNKNINMMTIRVLVNTFLCKGWGDQMFLDEDVLDVIFTDNVMKNAENKLMCISLATLILNYSVLIVKYKLGGIKTKLLPIIMTLIVKNGDEESKYRLLAAIGTLNTIGGIGENKTLVSNAFEMYNGDRFKDIKSEMGL